jgi:molecular chaperone GrpE
MANPDENEDNQRSTTAEALDDSARVAAEAVPDAMAELRREKDALQDRLLRLAAEFDNYRKRVERDRRDQADAAVAGAIEDMLPIIDNLERALEAPAGSDTDSYRQGVELIHRQMLELLRRRGVTPIDSVGTDFDPQIHQAVAHEVSPDHREGEVVAELRRGYKLGDRLLRPAMVKVAKA